MEPLFDILPMFSGIEALIAFIDFAIVFYVVYRILLLIKGTRAVQILVGLIVVIAFFFLSKNDFWTLPTTHWLVDKFIANFIIIAVIIFQSDIRRALAQFGRTTFFAGVSTLEETQVLEEVIKASVMLSQRRIGALVAIERNADLSHFIEEGIRVDATVSKDILFSIFMPEHQNPLHDGAVIIQKGRVTAAGCFLPLTNNPRVEKTLGTRHRAAIGLSEDTDATVIIVSEETGIISIAYKEELFRELDANEMRDVLQRIFSAHDLEDDARALLERLRPHEGREREDAPDRETHE